MSPYHGTVSTSGWLRWLIGRLAFWPQLRVAVMKLGRVALGLVCVLLAAAVLWALAGRLDPPRYQIVDHAGFLVRLDTRTGEMRAFVVASRQSGLHAQERGIDFFEIARLNAGTSGGGISRPRGKD